jgi:hypothetical protein
MRFWHGAKVSSGDTDRYPEGEVMMSINAVHTSPAAQNEAAVAAAPRQSAAPQQASLPQDKVTLSPQAQAHAKQAPADKDHDGDSK